MKRNSIVGLLLLLPVALTRGASVYVDSASVDGTTANFGSIDLTTGEYRQLGQAPPEGLFGLAGRADGTLNALTYASNLVSFNPATGLTTRIGATGLESCVVPTAACGPTSGSSIGGLAGSIYGTDFSNNLYKIDPATAHATLIGATGIPAIPFIPGTQNADGTLNFYDQAIFGFAGKLYITFDSLVFDPNTESAQSTVIAPSLYVVDPATARATLVGPTALAIGAVANVDGTLYAFDNLDLGIYTIDPSTGGTTSTGISFDPSAGVIQGAVAATPEPGSVTLVVLGISSGVVLLRRHYPRAHAFLQLQ